MICIRDGGRRDTVEQERPWLGVRASRSIFELVFQSRPRFRLDLRRPPRWPARRPERRSCQRESPWRTRASGIVTRESYGEHPPRAQYALTDKGRALGPVLRTLRDWGTAHTRRTK